MASIGKHGKGKRLWLCHKAPVRVQIYLGQITKRQEREILRIVEPLEDAVKLGIEATASELRSADDLNDKLREKLREHGLLKGLNARLTIGEFGCPWVESRKDISAKRQQDYLKTIGMLEDYFGTDKVLNDITVGEAKSYRSALAQEVAEATVAFRIKMIKCLFNNAVDFGHITSNPFEKVKSGSQDNDRFVYVSKGTIDTIIDDVTCPEWKAMITLWRYGGLRAQEPLHLNWDDVDWANRRLTIHDVKRNRERVIPLWPEIEAALAGLFETADEGQVRIITKYKVGQKLGTQFTKIIKQAGFEVWPKPMQNLRASCQNDLESAGHRMTAICSWIGNSKPVAAKHYLKVTAEDFTKALDEDMVIQRVMHDTEQPCAVVIEDILNTQNTAIPVDAQVCLKPKTPQYAQQDSNLRPTD
jgi:integrase